ncbi:MAG: hypothetical protein HY240_10915 [Actinobacteria bacterium]|nr:hypothetical protein [Actinomycetota bacterium]
MNEQTLDLRDYARLIRAQRRTVLIFALIFAVGSLGYSVHKGRTFTASARVVVEPVVSVIASQTNVPNQLLSPNMETESELVKSLAIAQGVRSSLVLQATAEQLVKGVRVSVVSNTDVLVVSYVDRNPATAARLANAFADEYVTQRRNDARLEVQSALQSLQDRLASDEEQLSQLKDQIAARTSWAAGTTCTR